MTPTPKVRSFFSSRLLTFLAVGTAVSTSPVTVDAAPYASGFVFEGNTVRFTLNEPADLLSVSINGGPAIVLDGTTSGLKSFTRTSLSDTFSVTAIKNDPIGYTIPTGSSIAAINTGLSQPTNEGGFRLISDDSNSLVQFNSPRGVAVATNPNNPQFGVTYISNSAAGSTTGVVRSVGEGLYALKADQSDAFGYGDIAQVTGFENTTSASSPFRLSVGSDHNVYVADWSDANGGVYRTNSTLTAPKQILDGIGGNSTLPAGQNHGSVSAVYVSGSANGDLSVYTVDEDLTSAHLGIGGATNDKNSLWRYDIGTATDPFVGTPTKVNQIGVLVSGALADMDRGRNGNFYMAQYRSDGRETGLAILSPDGEVLYRSIDASRALLGDGAAFDILRNVQAIAISLDQGYLAAMLTNSDIAVMPLDANGIPEIANRLIINTGTDVNFGRDIAFDAAGNIHYVSSGQALYRVLAPGGYTQAITSFNGTSFDFAVIPEPSSVMLLGTGMWFLLGRRRKSDVATA